MSCHSHVTSLVHKGRGPGKRGREAMQEGKESSQKEEHWEEPEEPRTQEAVKNTCPGAGQTWEQC